MKLKYYLRGLGIGIVVTAIIMSITNKPEEMTDAEVKMRALELGMVEESVLADLQAKDESTEVETVEDILNQHAAEKDNQQEIPAEETTDVEVDNEDAAVTENEEVAMEETATTDNEEVVSEETIVEENKEAAEETTVTEPEEDSVVEEVTVANTNEVKEETDDSKQEDSIKDEVVESFTIIKVEKGNGSEIVSRRLYEAGLVESAVEYNQFLVKNGYDRRLSVGNHEIPSGATHEEMARILCGMK